MQIETVTEATFEQVLPLIAAYQVFYEQEPDEARNRAFFSRYLSDHSAGIQFVALDENRAALGFATLYFVPSSTRAGIYCLMNDLYTVPEARGSGIGRALITHCLRYAEAHGYSSITWMTAHSNTTAQRLYDSTGAGRSSWLRYTLHKGG